MSLQSGVGNVANLAGNAIDMATTTLSSGLSSIVGSVTTSFVNIWDGGFAGIDTNNVGELSSALETYCSEVEAQIAKFDENGALDEAYKGLTQTAAKEFVFEMKGLLQAYVSQIRLFIEELNSAVSKYTEGDTSLGSQISSQASDIRSQAQSMRID